MGFIFIARNNFVKRRFLIGYTISDECPFFIDDYKISRCIKQDYDIHKVYIDLVNLIAIKFCNYSYIETEYYIIFYEKEYNIASLLESLSIQDEDISDIFNSMKI